jgi:cytoskeletal protein CcmA (bactofilin family)
VDRYKARHWAVLLARENRQVIVKFNDLRDSTREIRGFQMQWRSKGQGKDSENREFTGFLDKGVRFEGTLEVSGVFRIDAQVKGNLLSSHSLILGEGARVEGQIEGTHVVIAGKFDGVIFAKGRVEIQAKGVVTGEIHTPCLMIEPGGIFDGRCHMLAASESTKPLTIPIRASHQA